MSMWQLRLSVKKPRLLATFCPGGSSSWRVLARASKMEVVTKWKCSVRVIWVQPCCLQASMTPLVVSSYCSQGLSLGPYQWVLCTVRDNQVGYYVFNSQLYNMFFWSLDVPTVPHFPRYDSFLSSSKTPRILQLRQEFLALPCWGRKDVLEQWGRQQGWKCHFLYFPN